MTTMPLRVALDPRVANLPPDLLEYYEQLWARSHCEDGRRAVYCALYSDQVWALEEAGLVFPTQRSRCRSWDEGHCRRSQIEVLHFLEAPLSNT